MAPKESTSKAPNPREIELALGVAKWLARLAKHNADLADKVARSAASEASGRRDISATCRAENWAHATFWRHVRAGHEWLADDLATKGTVVF